MRGRSGRRCTRLLDEGTEGFAEARHSHVGDTVHAASPGRRLGFERSPTSAVIVHIFTQRGRSTEVKQLVHKTLAERLAAVGVNGKNLFVRYFENRPDDWSFADGRAQYVEGDLPVPGR
ncbi:Tautomerase enzyme [Streptomyces sp. DI166]|uniref:tautomerase family protein n=1 Tax=Streptomyces sp. DI166 TaxID=1839783 RepID=UPI0007F4C1BD|nr:tautomerase family protein [Streptomyces sp. DI166]SBT94215.1 Tautomerase enzyme [Streptomyces sp. DI166]